MAMSVPVFQHRHYVRIAEIIATARGRLGRDDTRIIAEHFADALRHTNPNFDRQRFISAAMGEPSNGRDCTGADKKMRAIRDEPALVAKSLPEAIRIAEALPPDMTGVIIPCDGGDCIRVGSKTPYRWGSAIGFLINDAPAEP